MTTAQFIRAATKKYANAPKPAAPPSPAAPTGGLGTSPPKPAVPAAGGVAPIKPIGAPAGGTQPLAKPAVGQQPPLQQPPQQRRMTTIQEADAAVRQQAWNAVTGFFGGNATQPAAAGPAAQPQQPAAPATTTPLTTQPNPTLAQPPAQPATTPSTPAQTVVSGGSAPPGTISMTPEPAPSVTVNAGTAGQPTAAPKPTGAEGFVAAMKDRSGGKEPEGRVIDMTKPLDVNEVAGHFGPDSKLNPEQQTQLATDLTTKLRNENPQYYEGFQDIQAGRTDTEAAKAYQGRLQQAEQEFIQQQVQADPQKAATPQGFGEIVNNAMSTFQNMPMPLQAMVGIGLPVGLIGIMSGLFGEGGMGMGILGALGLGAGVLGGAAGGLFGQGAQNMASNAAYQVGSFLGMAPEAREGSLDALRGEDAIARMTAGPSKADQDAAFQDPAAHAKKVQQQLDQAGQVRQLMNLPEGMRPQFLRNIDPSLSEEDAVIAARNAAEFATQMDTQDSPVSQMLQQGRDFVANPHGVVNQKADEHIRSNLPWGTQWAAPYIRGGYQWANGIPSAPEAGKETRGCDMTFKQAIEKWAFNDMDAKELNDLQAEKAKGVSYRVEAARRENELKMRQKADGASKCGEAPVTTKKIVVLCMKSARCWAGYEPVPGKKPYSNDSCRPVGSGKKKSQPKKKKSDK